MSDPRITVTNLGEQGAQAVFGVLIAMGLLGEQLHIFHVAGMALILGGLLVAGARRRRAVAG